MGITLDGSTINSESDLHRVLSEKLNFGPYYGNNLNALWDRMTADVERPVQLVWKDSAASRNAMGNETFERIVKLFREVEEQDRSFGRTAIFTFTCE